MMWLVHKLPKMSKPLRETLVPLSLSLSAPSSHQMPGAFYLANHRRPIDRQGKVTPLHLAAVSIAAHSSHFVLTQSTPKQVYLCGCARPTQNHCHRFMRTGSVEVLRVLRDDLEPQIRGIQVFFVSTRYIRRRVLTYHRIDYC